MKKFISFALMALFSTSLWAATETIKTSGSNTAYDGTCVSVAGTYIAGGVSSGYSKLRTNQESNTITLAVKSGYKILGFSIQAYSNNSDAAKTISMTSLSYDGGSNVLTEDVVFSGSGTKPSSPNYTNNTNNATSSIVMTFDNTNVGSGTKQIMAIIILTYVDTSAGPEDPTLTYSEGAFMLGGAALDLSSLITESTSTGAITYSVKTDGGTGASIDGNNFTATNAGTVVITASQAEVTDVFNAIEVDFNVIVAAAPDYLFISADTLNTKDFVTGATLAGSKVTISGTQYSYATLAGTAQTTGQKELTKYIAYNAKTTETRIRVTAYNKNSSSNRNFMVFGLLEDENSQDTIKFANPSFAAGTIHTTKMITFNNTKNRTIYFCVPSNAGDIYFLQIEVWETGDDLKMGGEIGYSVNLKKGRMFMPSATKVTFEGITYYLYSNYNLASAGAAVVTTLGTHYIKFNLPVRTQVDITTSDNNKYYVATECSTKDEAKTNATDKSGKNSFVLSAGDWYINGNGNNVSITKIEFVTPPVDPTSLDNTTSELNAIKRIENGQLIIEKNGVRYNALGQTIR